MNAHGALKSHERAAGATACTTKRPPSLRAVAALTWPTLA
jgi:hypothetical protein